MNLEIPEEFINGNDDNFRFNPNPEWLPVTKILPSLEPFSVDSDFHKSLQELLKSFQLQNGVTLSETEERETLEKLIETVIAGIYDTESKYVWLICCVSRIFLQKSRTSNSLIIQSDVFKRYNCESLYCPAKMHHITKELYEITQGNTFSIAMLVSNFNHINPVLHYICVCLVSAGLNRISSKSDPKIFRPHKPSDLIVMLKGLNLASGSINYVDFHEFLKLLSLYNSLVVMNKELSETHAEDLVQYFTRSIDLYVKAVKKWLLDASNYVEKLMTRKPLCLGFVDLKQQILMELQYGLRDFMDETTVYADIE